MADLHIISNVPWRITESGRAGWITSISPENGNANQMIAITYVANPLITEREATLTLSATDAGATESIPIPFTSNRVLRARFR